MSLLLAIIYIAFISLGLPDAMLGSAWPIMHIEIYAPVSYAGVISMIICAGTIIASLKSDWLTKRFGTGKVTAFSVALTAVSLFGFSVSNSFLMLCVIALPYGLGAGAVDAALNNYVALHFEAKHMSWLHCFWGVGASLGPYIMGACLTNGLTWHSGYRTVGILQVVLTAILFMSLPMWKTGNGVKAEEKLGNSNHAQVTAEAEAAFVTPKSISTIELFQMKGAKPAMLAFFCYCGLEQTAGIWASSYLVIGKGLSEETAAGLAALFYLGITVGRFLSGFITMKLNDRSMVRLGQGVIMAGIVLLCLPLGNETFSNVITFIGLVLVGLGCAPIYPSLLHATPEHFGESYSQAIMGIQMACAYVGSMLMPPVFGLMAEYVSIYLYPVLLLVILILMIVGAEGLNRQVNRK